MGNKKPASRAKGTGRTRAGVAPEDPRAKMKLSDRVATIERAMVKHLNVVLEDFDVIAPDALADDDS